MTFGNDTVGANTRFEKRPGSAPEGKLTKEIESQTRRIPSGVFLALAGGSIALSLGFKLAGQDKNAAFVGDWAPTILLLGIYNKLVKENE